MNQPSFEVAAIIRQYGKAFIENVSFRQACVTPANPPC